MDCPTCGRPNPEGNRHCAHCGALLLPAAPPAPPPPTRPTPAPPPPIEEPTAPPPPTGTTPTPTPSPAAAPAAPEAAASSKGFLRHPLLVAVSAAVVGALITGTFAIVNRGSDDEEVVMERLDTRPEDGFWDEPGDDDAPNPGDRPAMPNLPPIDTDPSSDREVEGSTQGLYGGSGNRAVCNVDGMIAFLTDPANAGKARAWADTHGIEPGEIESFLRSLTPVRLRFDTAVTNHGYRNGEANGYPAILQAGTAVLVDSRGVPRAKCNCGNPLLEADDAIGDSFDLREDAQNPEDVWDGFDPQQVVTVTPGDEIDTLVMVDFYDGSVVRRPPGTNGQADVPLDRADAACEALAQSTTCGGPGPQPTDDPGPSGAVYGLVAAAQAGDCTRIADLYSDASWDVIGITREQFLADCGPVAAGIAARFSGFTLERVYVQSQDQSSAVVVATESQDGTTADEVIPLVREDDRWKIDVR